MKSDPPLPVSADVRFASHSIRKLAFQGTRTDLGRLPSHAEPQPATLKQESTAGCHEFLPETNVPTGVTPSRNHRSPSITQQITGLPRDRDIGQRGCCVGELECGALSVSPEHFFRQCASIDANSFRPCIVNPGRFNSSRFRHLFSTYTERTTYGLVPLQAR